jgi:hypothetical protein
MWACALERVRYWERLPMKRAILRLPLLLSALAASTAIEARPAAAQGSRSVTFDHQKPGTPPGAFDCDVSGPGGPGRWVVTQALAEGGIRRVLAQTSQVAAPDRLPICALKNFRGADVDVVALVRPVSGSRVEAGGIAWRVFDRNNFYALVLDGRTGELSILRVERGRPAPLPIAGEDRKFAQRIRFERDRWYQLRVRATGARFEVFVDSAKRFEVEDSVLAGAGGVGIVTISDSVVQFDAFSAAASR